MQKCRRSMQRIGNCGTFIIMNRGIVEIGIKTGYFFGGFHCEQMLERNRIGRLYATVDGGLPRYNVLGLDCCGSCSYKQ